MKFIIKAVGSPNYEAKKQIKNKQMKSISFFVLLITPFCLQAQSGNNVVKYENIEWTNIWISSASKSDLPRVLLIGNSISMGYYPIVEHSLNGKAYVARYSTSHSIADPALFEEIKNLLVQHKFDVIHFNNGLHGIDYDASQFERGLRKLVRLLQKYGKGARLIGATSTRVLPGFLGWKSDDVNQKMIETRNKIMFNVCSEKGIEVDDLYKVTVNNLEMFLTDKIHYNQEGYQALGEQVTSYILQKLNN